MSRPFLVKIFAPAALAAGVILGASLSSTPAPAAADVGVALQQGVPSLAPMLKGVVPAVVNIGVRGKKKSDPVYHPWFGMIPSQTQPFQAMGSGVVVDASKGYILTNNHVVEDAETIKVRFSDDRELDATLIGGDPSTDIAVIQVKDGNLKAVAFADSDKVEVGDFVVAIGSPLGLRQTVTSGIVSALGRSGLGGNDSELQDFIQTDASINVGNSGGPLVNLKGELIGINSRIFSPNGGNIGLGFSIPSNLAKSVMGQLIEYGKVSRGRIGVTLQNITPNLAKSFGLETSRGAVVTKVLKDSPAAKGGVKEGDIIVSVNGREVKDLNQARNLIGLTRVDEKVRIGVIRDGKPRDLTVTVGKDTQALGNGEEIHPKLAGVSLGPIPEGHPLTGQVQGVYVEKIKEDSVAAEAGLREGDIIGGVNRRPVTSVESLREAAGARSDAILLYVFRGDGALYIGVQ